MILKFVSPGALAEEVASSSRQYPGLWIRPQQRRESETRLGELRWTSVKRNEQKTWPCYYQPWPWELSMGRIFSLFHHVLSHDKFPFSFHCRRSISCVSLYVYTYLFIKCFPRVSVWSDFVCWLMHVTTKYCKYIYWWRPKTYSIWQRRTTRSWEAADSLLRCCMSILPREANE